MNIPMEEAGTAASRNPIGVMTRAWTADEPFDHRGEFWSFNDMTVLPKPVQEPHPPLWVAAASPGSMDRIAQNGWNLLVGQGLTFDQVGEQVAYFKGAVGEAGGDFDPYRVKVARAMYTAPTRKQAREDAEEPFMWFKTTGDEVGRAAGTSRRTAARELPGLPPSFRCRDHL